MKSLYRRYRPLKLSDVVGQEQVTGPLLKSLKQGKINHAYLFIGPRGCGKTSVARILAHEINGFKYDIEDEYVDIVEIDGASNRGIDDIRELRDKAAIAPTAGKYKVYIIDEVHMLTKEAFNALLKTLEEPPQHVVFIMATTDAYKVPVTITSRSQTFTFKLSTPEVMKNFLESVIKKENIKINSDALDVIVRRGGGSFRDSLSLLDQISTLSDDTITKELVISALGLAEDEKVSELLSCYSMNDNGRITTLFKDLFATGVKPETIAEEMIRQIIENPKPEFLPLLAKLPDVKAPYAEAKLLVALLDRGGTSPSPNTGPKVSGAAYAEMRTEPPLRSKPIQSVKNIVAKNSNQKFTRPTKEVSASQEKTINSTKSSQPFDWMGFLDRVNTISSGVHMKLAKAEHLFDGKTLYIYIKQKNVYNYISSDKNKAVLYQAIDANVKITIENAENAPSTMQNDDLLENISDIMGGEVTNDGGGSPF